MESKAKKILNKLSENQIINESSLSRIKNQMSEHDTGFITAFRSFVFEKEKPYQLDADLIKKYNEGNDEIKKEMKETYRVTREQNLRRNYSLMADLTKKYNLTVVQGKYIENYNTSLAQEVGEVVFFVVDHRDTGELKNDLKKLGQKYSQDSILFIPKGGEKGILIGTSELETAFPDKNIEQVIGGPIFGKSGEFMTKVKGRPFVFESVNKDFNIIANRNYDNLSRMGEWGRASVINADWRNEENGFIDYREKYSEKFVR